jgi:hypothetical protein
MWMTWQALTVRPWEWGSSAQVFPATGHIFRAFNTCPMARVKVVILGGAVQVDGIKTRVESAHSALETET